MRLYELDIKVSAKDAFADVVEKHGIKMTSDVVALLTFASKIGQECQPYLKQTEPGRYMYRGLGDPGRGSIEPMLKKDVRLDKRTPMDSTDDLHALINDYFIEKHGAPFRNAMFATGDRALAGEYGKIYSVFPIGNFEFLWSPDVKDLWAASSSYRNARVRYTTRPKHMWKEGERDKYWTQVQDQFKKEILAGYVSKDLSAAIESGKEIMVRSKSYYAISFGPIATRFNKETGGTKFSSLEAEEKLKRIFWDVVQSI